MTRVSRPSILPTLNGDLLKRANLLRFIREFIQFSNMPDGYYMEFGLLNGEGMIDAYRQLRGVVQHFIGFDSFEGIPDLDAADLAAADYAPHFSKGNFRSMSAEFVRANILASSRMQEDELTLVPGVFSESLPKLDKDALRARGVPLCVYIDCDLYSSTLAVLRFLDDLLVTGTWVLFDDYWFYRGSPLHGEQRAVREWLAGAERVGLTDYGNFNGFGRAFIAYEK